VYFVFVYTGVDVGPG